MDDVPTMPEPDVPEVPDSDDSSGRGRRWLGWTAAGLGALGALCGLETFALAPERLEVTHHDIPVDGLPDALDGYTIAHLTDLHFGATRGAHLKTLDWIEANEPDLVVCTGDLVEGPETLPAFERFTSALVDASPRIVSIFGNWERRWNRRSTREIVDAYQRCRLPILSNESVALDNGLVITGADDPVTGFFDPAETFADIPDGDVHLFLIHAPARLDTAFPDAPTFDLSLAGHTHGGQFRIGSYAPVTPGGSGRFTSGSYDTAFGPAYVSRGIGMTFIRGRFMCAPELPVFTLAATSSGGESGGERR